VQVLLELSHRFRDALCQLARLVRNRGGGEPQADADEQQGSGDRHGERGRVWQTRLTLKPSCSAIEQNRKKHSSEDGQQGFCRSQQQQNRECHKRDHASLDQRLRSDALIIRQCIAPVLAGFVSGMHVAVVLDEVSGSNGRPLPRPAGYSSLEQSSKCTDASMFRRLGVASRWS
jgi:hypothetical protein